MKLTRWQTSLLRALPAVCGLFAADSLHAQSSGSLRPSSNSRPVGGSTSSAFGGSGGGGSSSSSQTGPRQYRSNTLLGDAIIQIDPETRSLIVVTDEETHAELEKVIKELDRPKPQVLIKVVFLEVTWDKDSDIGVEGNYTFNLKNPITAAHGATSAATTATSTALNGGTTTSTSTLAGEQSVGSATLGGATLYGLSQMTTGSFVRLAGDNWAATLTALATHGKTEVLSRPTIMARNNQQAVIIVGQEVPFVTNSRVTDTGQTINTVQYDNVGIILSVTPFITNNNMVEMIVSPEISALTSQTVAISNTASSPVISKRSAETVVVIPDGTTSVIGGLMQKQRVSTINKVPYLGDIPVLGLAFKHTVKTDTKTELLIFLTPYIVRNEQDLSNETTDETTRATLMHKAFTEKEMNDFLANTKFDGDAGQGAAAKKSVVKPDERRSGAVLPAPAPKKKATSGTPSPAL